MFLRQRISGWFLLRILNADYFTMWRCNSSTLLVEIYPFFQSTRICQAAAGAPQKRKICSCSLSRLLYKFSLQFIELVEGRCNQTESCTPRHIHVCTLQEESYPRKQSISSTLVMTGNRVRSDSRVRGEVASLSSR